MTRTGLNTSSNTFVVIRAHLFVAFVLKEFRTQNNLYYSKI